MALAVLGCGSSATHTVPAPVGQTKTTATATQPSQQAHPQVVEPVAGQAGNKHSGTRTGGSGLVTATQPAHDPSPNAPASVSVAPAKGAPSDAEVRAAVAKFRAAVAQYHLDRLNLSGALLNPALLPAGQYYVSIASVFTDYNLPIACGGVLHVPQLGVANKTLPCGTEVTFVYGNRAIRVPVLDRGPYIAGREWDLTGATAEALHFPGLGPIKWKIG